MAEVLKKVMMKSNFAWFSWGCLACENFFEVISICYDGNISIISSCRTV